MNDDKLNKAFEQIDIPPVDKDAKQRAINLAMSEFIQAHTEKKQTTYQGLWFSLRPIKHYYNESRKMMMNILNNKLFYSGFATIFVAVMGGLLFQQFYVSPEIMHDDESVYELDKNVGITKIEPVSQAKLEKPKAQIAIQRPSRLEEIVVSSDKRSASIADTPISIAPALKPSIKENEQNLGAALASSAKQHTKAHGVHSFAAAPTLSKRLSIAENKADFLPKHHYQEEGRDRFEHIDINNIKRVSEEPVSTFSIDVDTASYSFIRRQLNQGVLPQKDAVRVEEMLNYFDYQYPLPKSKKQPFKPTIVVEPSPWNSHKKLIHIGIKAYDITTEEQARSNIVLLLDVSGSMNSPDKLPLVKQSMNMLMNSLRPDDTIGIVVYAGAAGKVLEPTAVKEKQKILDALNRLQAGGSTAGAQGIQLAYQLAESNFDKDAVNRIILATDGDFNVGINNREELKGFVERKREKGIYLSVLGFGQGNYHDHMMQTLAQNGNGVAAYIDSLSEAQKILIDEATSTLFPVAKDVKIQVEFNPNMVEEYRLVGYETRSLKREDFNNDKVDAGDIGAGHSVTAIYEITPSGAQKSVDALRYTNKNSTKQNSETFTNEYGFLKIRYKLPKGSQSKLITQKIKAVKNESNTDLQTEINFATAVAGFAQLLSGGQYIQQYNYDNVINLAQNNKGDDLFGYRSEFIQLVRKAKIASAM